MLLASGEVAMVNLAMNPPKKPCPICGKMDNEVVKMFVGEERICLECFVRAIKWAAEQSLPLGHSVRQMTEEVR